VASATPSLKIISPPQKAAVGEKFELQVDIRWQNSDGPYEVQADSPLFEGLTLVHQGQSEEAGSEETRVLVSLEIEAVKQGEGRVLPFEVRYRKAGSDPWQSLPVSGQKILVYQPFPFKAVSVVLLTLLAAVAAVWSMIALIKFRKAAEIKRNTPPPDPKQRIYARAEEAIVTFKGETQKETLNHWARQVKEVVVAYYDIPERGATEREILEILKSRSLQSAEMAEVGRLFREIEQLKFMHHMLPVREMETLQKTLLQYVRGKIIIENP
jgi:hypothetical protein